MPQPIYTADNTNAAYQLDWSYSIFWHEAPANFDWFDALKELNEKDHIRLLQHQFTPPNVSQFLISTTPSVAPRLIVQRVKGRLQALIRGELPNAFRRNYSLRSIGSTRRQQLDDYLAGQLEHHPVADPRVLQRLEKHQIHQCDVDLSGLSYPSRAVLDDFDPSPRGNSGLPRLSRAMTFGSSSGAPPGGSVNLCNSPINEVSSCRCGLEC